MSSPKIYQVANLQSSLSDRVLKAGDTMTGNLNVASTLITQNVIPNANVTYDLGTSTARFKDLWLSNSTIYLGEASISAQGGNVSFGNADIQLSNVSTKLNVTNDLFVSGNVGIGTNDPGAKLSLTSTGNTSADGIRLTFGSEARSHNIYSSLPTGRDLTIAPWRSIAIITGNGIAEGIITLNSYEYTVFGTGSTGTERARIDASGNLGVGTTSPSYPLDIRRDSGIYELIRIQNNTAGAFIRAVGNGGGSVDFGAPDTVANTAIIRTASTERVRITSGGDFIIQNGTAIVSDGSGTDYSARLSCQYNFPTVDTYLDSYAGTSYSGQIIFRMNSGGGAMTERARIDSSGNFLVGTTVLTDVTSSGTGNEGTYIKPDGQVGVAISNDTPIITNRKTSDGTLIDFRQDGASEGSISVSGATVSYNAFAGSHWSQLQDGSKTEILRGTVMESINELCEWEGEENERLPKCKISDTAGSKKVYGVFMAWDNDWTETNDMYVTAVGAFVCRVNAGVTVQEGDLLESNGDGTARVQADDLIRSSTIGKVTSTVKTHEYDDGSYCVPTVLYCG